MGSGAYEPIHVAVERVAAARPGQAAVLGRDEHGDVRLTYRELVETAARWSGQLAGRGVGPGDVVAVLAPRGPALPAALLAILRCGAAYAVLDHRWPEARTVEVLAALRPAVVAVSGRYGDLARRGGGRTWDIPPLGGTEGPVPVAPPVDPGATACVFFTSGTTGESKAVLSPHRATTRLFAPGGPMAFGPGRVMPLTSFLSWDAASLELWGMLTTGGTSVVVAEEDLLTPHAIADLVAERGVDTLWLTSSLFTLVVDEDLDCLAGLRQLFVGGEQLSPPHVRDFLDAFPATAMHNGYGPVESCVFATTHRISPADGDASDGIPIGRAVPGTGVLVLDGERVCEVDEPGELCLTGAGLASGYLGDEELTSRRFVDVPVGGRRLRVYRTGDRGRCDAEGVHHFLGRVDRQIKLRGHRIELDGVEAAARRVAPLVSCVAVALPGNGPVESVALYYCPAPGVEPRAGEPDPLRLREQLALRLPAYAVPSLVVALDRLPLTGNGKVDTAALRARVFPGLCDIPVPGPGT